MIFQCSQKTSIDGTDAATGRLAQTRRSGGKVPRGSAGEITCYGERMARLKKDRLVLEDRLRSPFRGDAVERWFPRLNVGEKMTLILIHVQFSPGRHLPKNHCVFPRGLRRIYLYGIKFDEAY
jgi:hypothetical protein